MDNLLFTEKKIGNTMIKNRFVRSATYESAAEPDGKISEKYSKIITRLANGDIGMIITGMISVSESGKSYKRQASLGSDDTIDAFFALNDEVHKSDTKIFAQLAYGGRQTMLHGKTPHDASPGPRDYMFQVRPIGMESHEITTAIEAFSAAAMRAQKAGFDGIQIHAAHGYLVSNFLSPLFNRRTDEWGGNSTKRFQLLRRIYESIREAVGPDFPVTAKINISDHMPGGITLEEATEHIGHLAELGIDAVEISCGSIAFAAFFQSRGKVPVKEFSSALPPVLRPLIRLVLKSAFPERKYIFEEGYNLWASEKVRSVSGDTPLIVVGGFRTPDFMKDVIESKKADFISLCRPFICEPLIVKKWSAGEKRQSSCTNCNKCLAGVGLNNPLKCYGVV